MRRNYSTKGVIIKRMNVGEADKILTVYTQDFGKIRCIAKGSRKPKSSLAGHVDVFNHVDLQLVRTRGLDIVTGCKILESQSVSKENLLTTSHIFLVLEMVHLLTPDEEQDEVLYKTIVSAMQHLELHADHSAIISFAACAKILAILGVFPQTTYCIECEEKINHQSNRFFMHEFSEGLLCKNCVQKNPLAQIVSRSAIKMLRVFKRESFSVISRLEISKKDQQEFTDIFTKIIQSCYQKESSAQQFTKGVEQMR